MPIRYKVSSSIVNGVGVYKKHQKNALLMLKVTKWVVLKIKTEKLMDIEDDILFNIRPMKSTRLGEYKVSSLSGIKIKLNVRTHTLMKFFETLIHELKHSEQYKSGMLVRKYDPRYNDYIAYWNQKPYHMAKTSFQQYWNAPWEVEARAAGTELGTKLFNEYKKLYNSYGSDF
jgi:hypothetical protein